VSANGESAAPNDKELILKERADVEERFREIAENISEVFWLTDPTLTKMLYISPAYEKIWGHSCQSVYDDPKSFLEAIHPEDRSAIIDSIHNSSSGNASDNSYRIIRPDGNLRWIRARSFPVKDETGKVIRIAGIAQDITNQRKGEEALRQSEERFRLAFEEGPLGMALVDLNFKFISVNRAYCEMLGYSEKELLQKGISDLNHPDDIANTVELGKKLITANIPGYQIQKRYLTSKGKPLWVQLTAAMVKDSEGKPVYGFAMIENIDQRKKAEEGLAIQHAVTRVLTESASLEKGIPQILQILCETLHWEFGGIWTIDQTSNKIRCLDVWHNNPRFAALEQETRKLEFSPGEEIPGMVWTSGKSFWTSDFSGRSNKFPRAMAARESGLRESFAFPVFSGKQITGVIEFLSKEIPEPDSRLIEMLTSLGTQIGAFIERKESEKAKLDLERRLHQSQKIEAIGQLAGGVAHDFNNTLMAINAYAELLITKTGKNDPVQQIASEILKSTSNGSNLTRQLLAFSRRQVLSPKIIDLNHAVREMEQMLQRLIGEDVELTTYFQHDLRPIKADPGQVEQILMNLSLNARDAMSKGGKLTIESSNVVLDETYAANHFEVSAGDYVLLAVTDSGIGMEEELLSHIFEPFFTTKEEGKGTGLGLATVYGIVRQSGGHISVYSQPGHGTTFRIYFPSQNEQVKLSEAPVKTSLNTNGQGETILLVDDNQAIRKVVAEVLELKGYRVLQAMNGKDALGVSIKPGTHIDVLITDVIMPEMNGYELGSRLRETMPHLKILYMSGYTEQAIQNHKVLDPGSDFVSKPVPMQALLLKIRQILSEPS
jgi:two-component system cell cycle sensor histidine kinase/response regulator CckA